MLQSESVNDRIITTTTKRKGNMGIRETMATAYYGTVAGGKAAAQKNKEKHGDDFYRRIGATGGRNGTTGGFASDVECDCDYSSSHFKRQCAGARGGSKSKRKKPQE